MAEREKFNRKERKDFLLLAFIKRAKFTKLCIDLAL